MVLYYRLICGQIDQKLIKWRISWHGNFSHQSRDHLIKRQPESFLWHSQNWSHRYILPNSQAKWGPVCAKDNRRWGSKAVSWVPGSKRRDEAKINNVAAYLLQEELDKDEVMTWSVFRSKLDDETSVKPPAAIGILPDKSTDPWIVKHATLIAKKSIEFLTQARLQSWESGWKCALGTCLEQVELLQL